MLSIFQEKPLQFHNTQPWSDIAHELLIIIDLYKYILIQNQIELEKLDHFRLGN